MGALPGLLHYAILGDGMNSGTSMQIKTKYGLVHVPSARKCRSWAREVHKNRAAGLPPEHAGWQAARTVFPYEARENYPPDALTVEEIVTGIATD